MGYPAVEFGLHSLRAGGATAAANAGVPDRLFKRHSRWRSENAKDGYVEDSVDKRLSVSRSIGLYPFFQLVGWCVFTVPLFVTLLCIVNHDK